MATRLSSYESILRGCANLGGAKHSQLFRDSQEILFEYINIALRKGLEYDRWPEYTIIEQRYWRDGLWVAGTYPSGSIVYHATTEAYWLNGSVSSTTDTPSSTSTTDWISPGDFARYISLTQKTGSNLATSETEIDAVYNMYQKDPRTNTRHGASAFRVTRDGITPISDDFSSVYLEFRARQDDMSGMVTWDAEDTYLVGDYVYYKGVGIAGEAYKVIVNTVAGEDPQDTPASFQLVEIPYILSTYIKTKAVAMWIEAGGGGASAGDSASNLPNSTHLHNRAEKELEDVSYNLRMRSGQYGSVTIRQI